MSDKETLAQWMMQHGYATGHGDTMEDLLVELDIQIVENWTRALVNGVQGEREACALLCVRHANLNKDILAPVTQFESGGYVMAEFLAESIRARGQA